MPPRARQAIVCLGLLLSGPFLFLPAGNDNRSERLPPPRPAWPDQPKMPFDVAPKPTVLGQTVFVPSTVTDGITAFDLDTGAERWTFTTDGPVRFAPAVWDDRLYVASDDGYLYCLDA